MSFLNLQKDYQIIIKLIVYYAPLVPIVTDDYKLSPSNYHSAELPSFNRDSFKYIRDYPSIFLSLVIYKKEFEFYFTNHSYKDVFLDCNKHIIQIFQKIHNIKNDSFIIPCYGFIHQKKQTESSLLFKFICNKAVLFDNLNDTEKSSIIYRILASITTIHEFGFCIRSLAPQFMLLDNENKCYYCDFFGITESKTSDDYGASNFISPKQYKGDVSALTDIFSFAKIINYYLTKISIQFDIIPVDDEKMDFLIKECINQNENEIPYSLLLFIQMHEENIFLKKTNKFFIDKIFVDFFDFLLTCGATGGRYITCWSQDIEKSLFRNLILKSLPDSFVAKYAYTEFEIELNKILHENSFLKYFKSNHLFKINFFAEIFDNKLLKQETDRIISQLPIEYQIINKIIIYENFIEVANEYEISILTKLNANAKKYFVENFDNCISYAFSCSISPLYILFILNENNSHYENSHNTIQYLLKCGPQSVSADGCVEILSHFDIILYEDISKLNSMFECDILPNEFSNKIKSKPLNTIIDENKQALAGANTELDRLLEELDQIKSEMTELKEITANEENQNKIVELMNDIQKEQIEIENSVKYIKK